MTVYPKVSAAEKYTEGPRPLCKCGCRKPMFWNTSSGYSAGGHWVPPYHPSDRVLTGRIARRRALNALLDAEAERRGSRCAECGREYVREGRNRFHWHHRDPATKEFNVTEAQNAPPDRVPAELAKCDLLCNRCHPRVERATRTHCKNGHELTEVNLYLDPRGFRQCRTCRTAADQRRRSRQR